MLSTRSMGGKLACGLVSLFSLLVVFGVTSAFSLRAHTKVIRNLERSIHQAQHCSDLVAAIGTLVAPLAISDANNDDKAKLTAYAERQRSAFLEREKAAKAKVNEIRRQLETAGYLTVGAKSQNPELSILFDGLDQDFISLESSAPFLGDPLKRATQAIWMQKIVGDMLDRSTRMLDPASNLKSHSQLISLLTEARADHQFYAWVTQAFGAAAIVLVVSLAAGGYFWILKPLRELQADFDRVASGDYAHRANVSTRDEIQGLAVAFNVMTEKFQDVLRNQNEQIQMQAQKLLQSERVAGIGFLATGVAHEINNPLGVISMCADAIARQYIVPAEQWKPADYAEGREYSQMICNETMRCQNITHRMLDFAHGSSGEKNFYDVTAIVREVVGLVGHLGKYNDRKILFDNSNPCEAWVCGEEIRQVILNLVANALQAMLPGGVLRISIHQTADQLDLAFQDDGCGMTPETLQQLFEPFFTTKDAGQGTGLGLSLTRKIIESHSGSISASSSGVGQGSTFRVRLPRAAVTNTKAA